MPATPSGSAPADDRNLVSADASGAASFEDQAHLMWQKNRKLVLGLCVAVIAVILGMWAWESMARKKETDIEQAYAKAATPEQLKAFATTYSDHALAGVAYLRMADEAYAAGKPADALAGYEKAATLIKSGPFAARAQLGRALAKVQNGKASEAITELKQIANDSNQLKLVRAEAAYHLASMSVEAGNAADAQTFLDQISQIDGDPRANPWAMRAMALRMSMPAPAPVAAPAMAAPVVPATEAKKDDASPQVKMPGK